MCLITSSWFSRSILGTTQYLGYSFNSNWKLQKKVTAMGPHRKVLKNCFFTITAEILARSLANFYRQYADRHMNLKFVRRVSERERAIRPFVIVKNKLMSVFNESVLLLTMNFVITLSKKSADPQLL